MNRALPCPPLSTWRPSEWPVTPEVAGSSPVAPVAFRPPGLAEFPARAIVQEEMAQQPDGAVTFLFTDIEGSTRLIEEVGEARYEELLRQHRVALRDAFSRHGGVEVDTQGDALFYVFEDATAALRAAGDAQAALAEGPVAVRMGAHTGAALRGESGYVGREVHRAARIAAAGHGRQVVISAATAAVADGELTELGEHRLKDFDGPIALFQLGTDEFPPLKTISNTNLPRPASSFVGREHEVADVTALLRNGARLVTLTGPGGSGKTRLAIQSASELVGDLPAGVFWVGLATLHDSALVIQTIAQTLGAKEDLEAHINERELLLLLDNLEQVIDAAPELAALVEACPNLRLLATSRELLRVRGEVEYEVLPLAEPDAVELFCARAQVDENPAVEELCRRLDNLPLALELAAARVKVLAPEQILERLSRRLDLLRGGRDADPRQATLRATIEWSHDLLDGQEQHLFRRLAVFAGGCTLDAAEEILDAELDTLQALVEKSLVRSTGGRYWMLETVHAFASERLTEANEHDEVARRHAEWYAELGARLRGPAQHGSSEETALFEEELTNFRAALDWAASESVKTAFDLVADLWSFWVTRALAAEGLRWAAWVVAARDAVSPTDALDGLSGAGELMRAFGDTDAALRLDYELVQIFDRLGKTSDVAATLADISQMHSSRGEIEPARETAGEALALRRSIGDPGGIGHALSALATVEFFAGHFALARQGFEEAHSQFQRAEHPVESAITMLMGAEAARRMGDREAARDGFQRASSLVFEFGERRAIPEFLQEVAALAKSDEDAVRLIGSSDRLVEELGVPRWDLEDYERMVTRLESSLAPEAFGAAREQGRSLTEEDALELAMRCLD
jgi:predicted ATPase/class 3 adenylate cyclase